jgi:hypothetical protein
MPPKPHRTPWDRAAILLLLGATALVLATFRDYGTTWDEPLQSNYGDLSLRYYTSGLSDRRAQSYQDMVYYGTAFELPLAALRRVSPLSEPDTRHLFNALMGLLGLVGAWKVARALGGPRAGVLAVVLLALTPRWWGHTFNNPKDIPFAVGMIWSVHLLLRLLAVLPRPSWSLVLELGAVMGLTIGTRAGGLILFAYLGVIVAAWALPRGRRLPRSGALDLAARLAAACAVAWGVMLAFWPWAQLRPLAAPWLALARLSRFVPRDGQVEVLLSGRTYLSGSIPRTYALHWLAVTLPEIVLVLLALGAILVARSLVARRAAPDAVARHGIVAMAALLPLAYLAARRSPLFDGMRHVLFVVPPLACLAACALDAAWARLRHAPRWVAAVAGVALAGILGAHAAAVARLHPYETIYFNRLVGGLAGAAGRYDTDYWGNSYKEAVELLAAHLEEGAGGGSVARATVALCSAPQSGTHYFPPYLHHVRSPEQADFFIATTRFRCDERVEAPVVAAVRRSGVTLAVVKDLRERTARAEPATASDPGGRP